MVEFFASLRDAVVTGDPSILTNPLLWVLSLSVFALVLLLLLLSRGTKKRTRPDLLVSLGEITRRDEREPDFDLVLSVSNLGNQPVQIMEVSVETRVLDMPIVAEVAQLVAPHASVRLAQLIPEVFGETGKINLYLYTTADPHKYFLLSVPFAWEPWNNRYKAARTRQGVTVAKELASARLGRLQQKTYKQQERLDKLERERMARELRSRPEPRVRPEPTAKAVKPRPERLSEKPERIKVEKPQPERLSEQPRPEHVQVEKPSPERVQVEKPQSVRPIAEKPQPVRPVAEKPPLEKPQPLRRPQAQAVGVFPAEPVVAPAPWQTEWPREEEAVQPTAVVTVPEAPAEETPAEETPAEVTPPRRKRNLSFPDDF